MAGIGLGAGLSGFAKGFAATYHEGEEQKQKAKLEEKKLMTEMLIKHGFDDPSAILDPTFKAQLDKHLGEHGEFFSELMVKSAQHRQQHEQQITQASQQPGAITTYGPKGTTVRVGQPSTAEKVTEGETAREPFRRAAEARKATEERRKEHRQTVETQRRERQRRLDVLSREERSKVRKWQSPLGVDAGKWRDASGNQPPPRSTPEQATASGFYPRDPKESKLWEAAKGFFMGSPEAAAPQQAPIAGGPPAAPQAPAAGQSVKLPSGQVGTWVPD